MRREAGSARVCGGSGGEQSARTYNSQDGPRIYAHTWAEITAMFDGLELIAPGLADSATWRAEWEQAPARADQTSMIVAGLGRKD